MTYTAVGSLTGASVAGAMTSFSLTTGSAASGEFVLCEVLDFGGARTATALSSSNATWAALGSPAATTNGPAHCQVFLGTVTAASTATVTITWGAGATGSFEGCAFQEFSSTTGIPVLDKQGTLDSTGTSNWVSLTPAAAGEAYFGYAENASSAISGSTSGYTYNASVDGNGNGAAYNPNCGASATFPVWGDTNEQAGIMVLVMPPPAAGGSPQARPGRTWLRRFHHGQVLLPPGPPAAAAGVTGTIQPTPTLTPPRRKPARAIVASQKGGIAPAGIIQPPPTVPVPRRRPARAVVQFTPVATTNQVPAAAPAGTVQPPPTLTPPRLRPFRAVVEFTPVTTTNLVPGRQQPPPTFPQQRRRLVRAVIRGQAGTIGIPGTIQPAPTFPQQRRKPARAVIEFTPVTTVNQAGAAGPAGTVQPRPTLTWPRKRPARAGTALLLHPVRTVNQPAPPLVVPVNPLPNGGSTEGALWEMARTGKWPERPPGFGPVGPVPSSSAVPPKPGERGWVGKRKRRFSWPKQDE